MQTNKETASTTTTIITTLLRGGIFGPKMYKKMGKNYIKRSIIICTAHLISLGLPYQERYDGNDT
jgi:hypothetical protein